MNRNFLLISFILLINTSLLAQTCFVHFFEKLDDLAKSQDQSQKVNYFTNYDDIGRLERLLKSKKRDLTTQDLQDSQIPKRFWKYYDKKGKFHYKRQEPLTLAVENGDSPISTIRMNFTTNPTAQIISTEQIQDFSMAMNHMQDLDVTIFYSKQDLKLIKSILSKLPKEKQQRFKLKENDPQINQHLSLWAQDASKPSSEKGYTVVPGMYDQKRALNVNDNTLESYQKSIESLQNSGFVKSKRSMFFFEGGNVIVGDKHIFISEKDISRNKDILRISKEDTLKALAQEFGKPIIPIKDVDNFHIDLKMTVIRNHKTGKEIVLLASPQKAIDLIKDQTFMQAFKHGKNLKNISSSESSLIGMLRLKLHLNQDATLQTLQKQAQNVEDQKKKLQQLGYEVLEVPEFGFINDTNYSSGPNSIKGKGAPTFNYTNAIISGKNAMIPETGITALDNYTKDLYQKLGYNPIQMPVTKKSICLQGGIRCLSETYRQ